jgi:protein TonB
MIAAPAGGNRPPVYPDRAVSRGIEGRVVLVVLVRSDGSVGDVRIETSSGSEILDRAAMRAVRGWRFRPAMRDGIEIESELVQSVLFQLH